MLPPFPMLTTKKRVQIFLIFLLCFGFFAGLTGCAPAGARALAKGDKLIKEGKYSEAVENFEEAKTAFPNNAKVWNHLGLGYQYAGDPKKSAQAYLQALKLDRNLTAARYNLGALYLEQRNFPPAISELTTFTQLDPKNPEGWTKLGLAQMQFGATVSGTERIRQLDLAKRNLDYAQKLRPSAETLNAIGLIHAQRGRAREAISSFTAALQQQKDYAPALLNLAVIYQTQNERRLALANYREFLKVAKQAPETAQVQQAVRQLETELNPPAAVSRPAVIAKPPVATNVVVTTKAETNSAKPTKALPVISSPKTQPLPKTPVEVATVQEEPPIKPAQEIVLPQKIATNELVSNNNTTNFIRPSTEKGSGMLTKLNPVTWFKRKPKPAPTAVTEIPVTKPTIENNSNVVVAEEIPVIKKPTNTIPAEPKRTFPRYKYHSFAKPSEGKRVEAEPLFARAIQAQKDRRLADALDAYRQAIKLDPSFYEANYNMALVAREAGDLAAALTAYEQALAIMPESVNARYNFAFTLQEAGYFQDAVNELQKLLAQNPNETRAHLLLGNLFAQRLNDVPAARENYLKVLEAEPQHPQATQIRYWLAAHS
jgi:tetratricopeptide (TPR) repeat protein